MWETIFNITYIITLFAAGIRIAAPLLLAALGELVSEKAGILNIGLEGFMLIGSLAGFLGAYYSQSAWIGMLVGLMAGILISLLHAYLSITLCTDQVVNGIAINIVSLGLTSLVFRIVFGISTNPPKIQPLGIVKVPLLADIPILGPIFFEQSPIVYIAVFLVIVCWILLFRTDFGLSLRATGEQPEAADTAGINVFRMRYIGVMLSGAMAGLGGAFLSVAQLGTFTEGMTSGRGFIALAIVIFGRWSPKGILIAALFFGVAYAFQLSLQAIGFHVPFQFLLMLPYVLTMIALAGATGRRGAPAALATPYQKA